MRKKMLWGVLLIAVALLLITTGVYAYFSDSEEASGNTFAAGTFNLSVGVADPCTSSISVPALAPGDTGNAATWLVRNTGTISGSLSIAVGSIANSENTCYETETADGDAGDAQGELGANLSVALWMDILQDGAWSSGDYYLKSDGTTVAWASGTTLPAGAYDVLDNYGGESWADVQTAAGGNNMGSFRVEYDLPAATNNAVQSDSSVFDITFTLAQD